MAKLNISQECKFGLILKSMEATHYINKLKEKTTWDHLPDVEKLVEGI